MAYPYEYFKSIDDYQNTVNNLRKENFFSKLKRDYADDEEIERSKKTKELSDIGNGEKLTELYLKIYVILLICVFERVIKVSLNEFDFNSLFCVSLPG